MAMQLISGLNPTSQATTAQSCCSSPLWVKSGRARTDHGRALWTY